MRLTVAAVSLAVVALGMPLVSETGAAGGPSTASVHCRKQTITYTRGHSNALALKRGAATRTKSAGTQTVADG